MARRHHSLVPLSHDHRDALALAFRLHNPSPPGPATAVTPPSTPAERAAEVLDFFAGHLEGHFRAEEEVLFPAYRAQLAPDAPIAALLRELTTEHRAMERLRDAIAADAGAGADPAAVDAVLRELADVLERHIRREERELFVTFTSVIADDEARALGERVRAILDARPPLRYPPVAART